MTKRSDVARACAVVFMLGLARGAAAQSTLVGQMTDFFSQSIVLARTLSVAASRDTRPCPPRAITSKTEQLITQVSQQIGAQISTSLWFDWRRLHLRLRPVDRHVQPHE
ncbi:MAG: hypothetical protein U0Q11_25100 [Vicinamibacterales bacterium]